MSVIDALIDLVLDNIYFVAVALFFLFKLFGNSSRKNKQPGMPTFGGDTNQPQQQWDDDEDDRTDNAQYEQEQQRRQLELEQQRQLEQEAAERRRRDEEALAQAQRAAGAPSFEEIKRKQALAELMKAQNAQYAQKPQVKSEPAAAPRAIQVQRSDLQKAVIWSEILGQPRAKRPHRR